MSQSVFMRRVPCEVTQQDELSLEELFAAAFDAELYEKETEALRVYDLQMWKPVQLSLCDSLHRTGRVNDLPVFGGRVVGGDKVNPILLLDVETVALTAEFLTAQDFEQAVGNHLDEIQGFYPGVPQIKELVVGALDGLRDFYARAAEEKQCIVKTLFA